MIHEPLKTIYFYDNQKIELNLYFNNILTIFELYQDTRYQDYEKCNLAFGLLCKTNKKFNIEEKAKIINDIFDKFIVRKRRKQQEDKIKSFDFFQDESYIYSSFMKDYNIDLYEEQNRLDWRKFISLFEGLSKDTKMSEVIKIRTMEVPKANKDGSNRKQIESILKAKTEYSLNISAEEREKSFVDGLIKLSERFKRRKPNTKNKKV